MVKLVFSTLSKLLVMKNIELNLTFNNLDDYKLFLKYLKMFQEEVNKKISEKGEKSG